MAVHSLTPVNMNGIFGAPADYSHMMSARREQRMSGQYTIAVLCFFNSYLAERVESFGKLMSESFRHMLNDDNAGKVRWQRRQ